jgi:hypothetical protein
MVDVCIAFKAHMGWVNAVAVACAKGAPKPLHAQRIELVENSARDVQEPYHVAGGWHGLARVDVPGDPAEIVRRGRKTQVTCAREAMRRYQNRLADAGLQWVRGVLLTGRGRLGDLEHILGSHAQIHVAEGEAIRDATRAALEALGVPQVDQDEKSVLQAAGKRLGCSDADSFMKPLKPDGTRSWRKEERLIALAAWLNSPTR